MQKVKQELTTLTFRGPSFEDHGLELDMLTELVQYKKILLETAEHLWRRENPERTRLPRGFKDSLRIKFYEIRQGSTTVPLFYEREYEDDQMRLEYGDELNDAVNLVEAGLAAASEDRPLPENFPKNVIPLFGDLGKSLGPEDYIEARSPKRERPVSFTPLVRERLISQEERTYEDLVDLTGEVRAADLDGLNFTLRLEGGGKIPGKFEPEDEPKIIEAFKDHATCRLNILGTAEFSHKDGTIKRIIRVEEMNVRPLEGEAFEKETKPVWQMVMEIGASIPSEEWAKIPTDLSINTDHYLYGAPKIEK
ncbi:MAG: hypothetical protein AB1896_17935 [Thermodesulfobacteriota bacterium]